MRFLIRKVLGRGLLGFVLGNKVFIFYPILVDMVNIESNIELLAEISQLEESPCIGIRKLFPGNSGIILSSLVYSALEIPEELKNQVSGSTLESLNGYELAKVALKSRYPKGIPKDIYEKFKDYDVIKNETFPSS